jgi:DNA-binding MarR family transcriptional regulator
MNKVVDLVNAWAAFEENYPNDGIEDFCRHYLTSRRSALEAEFLGGVVPSQDASVLIKLLVKITRIFSIYMDIAAKDLPIKQAEEFYFLSVIKNLKDPKKTEVIFHTVNELSNGLNILNSLVKQGYVRERNDTNDKRSKRVSLTVKGEKALARCYQSVGRVAKMLFVDMPPDDIDLCIQLMKHTEQRFSMQWPTHKGKSFEEVYKEVMGK